MTERPNLAKRPQIDIQTVGMYENPATQKVVGWLIAPHDDDPVEFTYVRTTDGLHDGVKYEKWQSSLEASYTLTKDESRTAMNFPDHEAFEHHIGFDEHPDDWKRFKTTPA